MPNNNDVVIVDLDKKRELRFGHKALKRIGAELNKSVEELEGGVGFSENDLELIYFYGLQNHAKEIGEELTMEMMEDILDCAPHPAYPYLHKKMFEALTISMGGAAGNDQLPEATPSKPNRATRRATAKK
ncbi:hypothetical protein KP806_07570 [Paenibacillus sp. N4]|uniref:hypothetical protein n=1 Tax=Paenibacillus vietnamensis TaxID=2590547 RepID=UPI001CD0B9E1|nr:hypothetical protein [Paenibacillus vietnamensis]MCA0754905.1 hypothetical protein [Paenibacillus vietnamensis]